MINKNNVIELYYEKIERRAISSSLLTQIKELMCYAIK
jgi:hypothetical protein